MNASRLALFTSAVLATAGLAFGWTAMTTGTAPAASPCTDDAPMSRAQAYAQLAAVAEAHGTAIAPSAASYLHFNRTAIAHAPLVDVNTLTEADIAAGADIMAVVMRGDESGDVPDGAYIVRFQRSPGAPTGTATYLDAGGHTVARVTAYVRGRDELNRLFPGAYGDPPPDPPAIPNASSTHRVGGKVVIDCTGPGWNWRVITYST